MSTYYYYRCLSHTPPLEGPEISQHRDEDVDRAIWYAQSPEARKYTDLRTVSGNDLRWWLDQHPNCAIDVWGDNGRDIPIPGRTLRDMHPETSVQSIWEMAQELMKEEEL